MLFHNGLRVIQPGQTCLGSLLSAFQEMHVSRVSMVENCILCLSGFPVRAGKEFYALAWVMAGASRAIAQTLQQIPDTSMAAVVIPDVPGLPLSRMYEVSNPC